MGVEQENWKGIYVREIVDNTLVEGVFLVKAMNLAETRAGKPFLTLSLMDKTGEITSRVWDNAERFKDQCQAGELISISGQAQSYKGNIQLNIKALERFEKVDDLTEFLISSPYDVDKMLAELKGHVKSVDDHFIKELLSAFMADREFILQFSRAPAAKNMHHAYIGGLLEHTLALVRLAESVAGRYSTLDRSLLICGALLHDIGKIKEFSFSVPPFDYSDQGRLVGHMVLAIEMLNNKIAQIAGFPEELADRIKHLILSHHGRHEFGSPSLPMIKEAFVLNLIDDLDAKINYLDRLSGQAEGDGYQWTPYQRTLERFLFVDGHKDEIDCEDKRADEGEGGEVVTVSNDASRQPTLWEL